MIFVEIDELTPCLFDNESGELVETEVIRIKRKSFLSKYNKATGWYTNWSDLLKENEVYAIVVKGSVSIQGLVAVRPDDNMQTAFVTWMTSAPQNNHEMVKNKRFNGVGGHLFAIAAQKSSEYGYGGAISGFAADEDLMNHYINVFNAEPICMLHPYQFFIPDEEGSKLCEVYDYEWTEDII